MILLIIQSEKDVQVLTGQHISGVRLTPSVAQRSALVQALISDFDGQQCTTTLPLCGEAFVAWMHDTHGSLEQDANVLNVRHRTCLLPQRVSAVAW